MLDPNDSDQHRTVGSEQERSGRSTSEALCIHLYIRYTRIIRIYVVRIIAFRWL